MPTDATSFAIADGLDRALDAVDSLDLPYPVCQTFRTGLRHHVLRLPWKAGRFHMTLHRHDAGHRLVSRVYPHPDSIGAASLYVTIVTDA
jgi:hypothetical protein